MKLSNVAKYFNNTKFYDAYTGLELGVGQLDVYDDSKRDGLTAQRRVFEVAPGTSLPPRLAINFLGLNWLVGVTELDAFKGAVIREKHVLHQAEDLAHVSTIKQTLQEAEPHEAFAARVWVKSSSEVEISSRKYNQLNIYFSRAEDIQPDQLVSMAGKLHTVMAVYPAAAGHLVALAEELEDGAVETGMLKSEGKWDPITETYTAANKPLRVVKLRWQSDFIYYSQATPNFERGDMQVAALESPVNGATLTLSDGDWQVYATQQRNGIHYLHLRRL